MESAFIDWFCAPGSINQSTVSLDKDELVYDRVRSELQHHTDEALIIINNSLLVQYTGQRRKRV